MDNHMEEHTDSLCQAIASSDLHAVRGCLDQEKTDVNRRHCNTRTPLQIACEASSPEIVQSLIDHGAQITARMEDGQTALHLAAARGSVEIIRILCVKSDQNKEIARKSGLWTPVSPGPNQIRDDEHSHIRDNQGVGDSVSLVNVKFGDEIDLAPAGNYLDDQPETVDILDPDVVSWETFMSPLHVGILHGHVDAVIADRT